MTSEFDGPISTGKSNTFTPADILSEDSLRQLQPQFSKTTRPALQSTCTDSCCATAGSDKAGCLPAPAFQFSSCKQREGHTGRWPVTNAGTIYVNVQDPSVGVLQYYAILAYPGHDELGKRHSFVDAMTAATVKRYTAELGRTNTPEFYRRFKNERIYGAWHLASKRLADRINAGLIATTICWNRMNHLAQRQSIDRRGPHTVDQAIKSHLKYRQTFLEEKSAKSNVAHRVWANSFPVLHLTMTNPITLKIVNDQLSGRVAETARDVEPDLFSSIIDWRWLRESLEDAERLRTVLAWIIR